MKTRSAAAVALALFAIGLGGPRPAPAAEPSATLFCRGPYTVFYRWPGRHFEHASLGVGLRAGAHAAGERGAALEPGTCAWRNRPLGAADPPILLWYSHPGIDPYKPPVAQVVERVIVSCAASAACVLELGARRTGPDGVAAKALWGDPRRPVVAHRAP